MLQQGLHDHDQEGKLCFEYDKQWQWFEDHQGRQVPGIQFWVWFSEQAITNIICLKKLIRVVLPITVTYSVALSQYSHGFYHF